jgi:hypothetical protein
MEQLSIPDREAKTRRQLALVDTALTKEFATLPASVVHREVATVSDGLIANARFTDHVAVLTGRFAAEHLSTALPPVEHQTRSIALQEIAPGEPFTQTYVLHDEGQQRSPSS